VSWVWPWSQAGLRRRAQPSGWPRAGPGVEAMASWRVPLLPSHLQVPSSLQRRPSLLLLSRAGRRVHPRGAVALVAQPVSWPLPNLLPSSWAGQRAKLGDLAAERVIWIWPTDWGAPLGVPRPPTLDCQHPRCWVWSLWSWLLWSGPSAAVGPWWWFSLTRNCPSQWRQPSRADRPGRVAKQPRGWRRLHPPSLATRAAPPASGGRCGRRPRETVLGRVPRAPQHPAVPPSLG